jgi:Cap4-like dsDNA endonuclease family protein
VQSNERNSPIKIPSNDKGDDVQLRFRYQHSYITLIAVQMCIGNIPYKEIFCEQHEDAIAICNDRKFVGIQVKTRNNPKPFSLFDHEIKKSIMRFVRLSNYFPGQFSKFVIVSNCGFNQDALTLNKMQTSSLENSEAVKLSTRVNRLISQIANECGSSTTTVCDALCKLDFQQGPQFADIDSKIIDAHLSYIPICRSLSLDSLRQIFEEIKHLIYNASSKWISEPIDDYISFVMKGETKKFDLHIECKRITMDKIMGIIKRNFDSINAINKLKDSLLELVDIQIIDNKRDQFPQLDIKVRNIGDRIAFLKRAEIRVSRMWTLISPWRPRAVPISCNYDIILPLRYPNLETISLSQAIGHNDVDRFTLTLGNDLGRGPNKYVYQLNVLFVYDEDNKTFQTEEMLILSHGPSRILGAHKHTAHMESCREHNKQVLAELKGVNATKSEILTQIIAKYLHSGEVPYQ